MYDRRLRHGGRRSNLYQPETDTAARLLRPLSDILGCRIDVDVRGATVRGVTDVSGGDIALLRRQRSIDDAGYAVGTCPAAAKTSTATNFSHWALRVATAIDRRPSVPGRLMNRCVASQPSSDKTSSLASPSAADVTCHSTLYSNAHGTRTRNRRRKPAPENWYHKPARKYSMSYSLLETGIRNIRYRIAYQKRLKQVPVSGTGF